MTLNVVVSEAPIKGAAARKAGGLSLEQGIGGTAMLLGRRDMRFDPGDLTLQDLDSFVELGDRNRTEVLLDQQGQRVARAAGEKVVVVHRPCSVDPARGQVNKLAAGGERVAVMSVVIPDVMRAVEVDPANGGQLRLTSRPTPRPGPDEVLIKVAAAGVNRPDVLQRKGLYPPPPGASDIPGLEIAGTVVAAGEGAAVLPGAKVCALVAGGGYADYCLAPVGTCLPAPEVLPITEAAALPETLFTVWVNLFERGFAADGDTVLVHGGTSGIGTMAIRLGTLFGLDVIVTCGSEEKRRAALDLGATEAINYRTTDFVEVVKRVTGGLGVSVVLDMVGGDYVARNLQCLADDGRHVSIAFQHGARAEIDIPDIMRRRLTLTGSTLRARDVSFKTMVADEIARTVWPYVEGNRLRPVMDQTFPLAEAAAAHARMEAGDHVGKIVLVMDQ